MCVVCAVQRVNAVESEAEAEARGRGDLNPHPVRPQRAPNADDEPDSVSDEELSSESDQAVDAMDEEYLDANDDYCKCVIRCPWSCDLIWLLQIWLLRMWWLQMVRS